MQIWKSWTSLLLLAGCLFAYAVAGVQLDRSPRVSRMQEMQVALPLFAQVGMAGGDRYLAANLAGFRSLLVELDQFQKEDFQVLARVQHDVAWLNPAHEDNYYIGAAILPWNGEVDSAQYILKRAIDARPFDWQPAFYYAFGLYHFKRDPTAAAKVLLEAAPRTTDEQNRQAMEDLAARWIEKGYNPKVAIGVVEGMASRAQHGGFQRYLQMRVDRLRTLIQLQAAADKFRLETGRPLRTLSELVSAGLIDEVPKDPFKFGYAVGNDGVPILRTKAAPKNQ